MGNDSADKWLSKLPWVLLGRRTAFQQALGCSPGELVLGTNPTVPGDIVGDPGPPLSNAQIKELLEALRQQAAAPPTQTTHNRAQPVYMPDLSRTTHIKLGKPKPLGKQYEGPFEITERLGTSCIRIRVGSYANGDPRYEVQHWSNCRPAAIEQNTGPATRPSRGRPPLNPAAKEFAPATPIVTPSPEPPQQTEHGETPSNVHQRMRPVRNRKKPDRYGYACT